jgi:hypothetical protein
LLRRVEIVPCACAVGSTRAWATELAALSGRHKQLVGRTIDELEALGPRHPRPRPCPPPGQAGRPDPCGRAVMRLSDQIMTDIGQRGAQAVGADAYGQFRRTLQRLIEEFRREPARPDPQLASPAAEVGTTTAQACPR